MTTVYGQQIDTAKRLLDAKGGPVTIKGTAQATYDEATDEWTAGSPVEFTARAVVLPMQGQVPPEFTEALIRGELRTLYVAAKGLPSAIAGGMRVTFEGADWTVLGADPLAPDGTPILYTVTVRK